MVTFSPAPAMSANFTVAVVPQLNPETTHRNWAPFVRRVGELTGHTFQLRVYRTFDEFETDIVNGVPEFVYLNPYHQLTAHKAQGYVPIVRDSSVKLAGVLVTRSDSPIKSVRELNGRELGFPDPNAFAASLLMRAQLEEKENIKIKPRFYGSHGNVYRHVIAGDVPAGGGVNNTLNRERPQTREALRVLYRTTGAAPHPISAHPRVPLQQREQIQNAILAMAKDAIGKSLLKKIQIPEPMRANHARDYRPLEKLRLHRYVISTEIANP